MSQSSPGSAPHSAYLASPVYSAAHSQMQLSSLLESNTDRPVVKTSHGSPPQMSSITGRVIGPEAMAPDGGVEYRPPANDVFLPPQPTQGPRGRESISIQGLSHPSDRSSSSTVTGREGLVPEFQRAQNSLYKAPSAHCRYRCLDPVLPYLGDIIPASVACDLLDVYLTEPGSSLFRCASPYIITRIFRKKALLHPTSPRQTTPALLATMLWCSAQTADIVLLHVPGSRAKICNALYKLATTLITERDPDRWRRIHGILFCRLNV